MRRKSLHLFNIFPKKIVLVYFFGLFLILFTSSFVIIAGVSQISTFTYATINNDVTGVSSSSNQIMLTEHDVRTVYTSHVPVTIADALNSMNLSSSLAYPLTLTPVDVNGSIPLVVRGLPDNIILSQGITGTLNASSHAVFLGSKAEMRLHSEIGDVLSFSSPFVSGQLNLTVKGVFDTGTEQDYEAVVPFVLGEQIAGLPNGTANALVLSSLKLNSSIFTGNYHFTVHYQGPSGNLLFLDSSGYVHNSTKIVAVNNSVVTRQLEVTLPFGLYTLVLDRTGLRTTLSEFATLENNSVISVSSEGLHTTNGFLSVVTGNSSTAPEILDSSNATISPQYFNKTTGSWVFETPFGTYTLIMNSMRFRIFVFGNATFNANAPALNSSLNVRVNVQSGQASTYSITVKDLDSSRIIFSTLSTSSRLDIPVPENHSYEVAILTGSGLYSEQNTTVVGNETSLVFNIPYVPQQLQTVPISDYSSLGIGSPSAVASFNYFFGTITVSAIALFSIVIGLLTTTLFVFDSQFLVSIRKEIQAISYLFPRMESFFLRVGAFVLLLSMFAAILGIFFSYIAFKLFHIDLIFTFAGYGIGSYPMLYVAPILLLLSIISWIRISVFFNSRFGKTG
ncbi:MAG TPA: hypothetical protein VJN71_04195 [Nitrososphaerales archaeon]|nr:hypothetical protein [Nitrososphaerales archaeon]